MKSRPWGLISVLDPKNIDIPPRQPFGGMFFVSGCRLSLQLRRGAVEAISITQPLTEASLKLRGPLRSRLGVGVD
ncbi:hypothetical protein EYF80_029223 [Liparis tanakae]|uniref:Uncharacterized protein n=1 Tax=Liparis tanakae TaxID=230148 RepID=A0A4Z2H721_9TELE|nr:hypothetical protein EYF80_029223 [Liparis tanakae]